MLQLGLCKLHQLGPAPGKPDTSVVYGDPKFLGCCEHQVLLLELSKSIFLVMKDSGVPSSTRNGENDSRDICFSFHLIAVGLNEFLNKC